MNTRDNIFVIVSTTDDTDSNYIMDFISSDKAELTKICDDMNEKYFTRINAEVREKNKRRKECHEMPEREYSIADYKKYDVLTLSTALNKLVIAVRDYHSEQDESY